jgi:hypothetical protein
MVRKRKALEGSRALQNFVTGFVGNDSAVSVCENTTLAMAHSRLKQVSVAILARVFEWSPTLAIALARVVGTCWRGFKEA